VKTAVQQQLGEKSESERNSPADTKVSEEGGGEGAPGTGAEIPLQPVVRTMVRQLVPLKEGNPPPIEDQGGADIHPAACRGPHARAGGCALKEDVTQLRAHAGAGSWEDLWPLRGPRLQKSIPKGLYSVE